jgi:hypothetical protein
VPAGDSTYEFVGSQPIGEEGRNGEQGTSHQCTTERIAPNVAITAKH